MTDDINPYEISVNEYAFNVDCVVLSDLSYTSPVIDDESKHVDFSMPATCQVTDFIFNENTASVQFPIYFNYSDLMKLWAEINPHQSDLPFLMGKYDFQHFILKYILFNWGVNLKYHHNFQNDDYITCEDLIKYFEGNTLKINSQSGSSNVLSDEGETPDQLKDYLDSQINHVKNSFSRKLFENLRKNNRWLND